MASMARWRSSTPFITFVVGYAIFVDQFIFTSVVPVAPFSLQQRSGISAEHVQWWIAVLLAVYGGATLICCPIFGWITDRTHSRRWPFLFGLMALIPSSVLLWLSTSIQLTVLSRVGQGIACAVVYVTTFTIMVDTVGQEHIGEYMGYINIATNAGTVLGPLLGGVVYEKLGYNAVYIMGLAFLAGDVVLRFLMIERRFSPDLSIDEADASNHGITVENASYATLEKTKIPDISVVETGLGPAEIASPVPTRPTSTASEKFPFLLTDAAISSAALNISRPASTSSIATENRPFLDAKATKSQSSTTRARSSTHHLKETIRPPTPRLPPTLTLLASPRFLAALWAILVQAAIGDAFKTALPLHVTALFHWSPLGAGLIFLPLALPALLGPIFGRLSDRFGPRWIAVAGFTCLCPALILLRLVDRDASASAEAGLCVLLSITGLCLAVVLEPVAADITAVVSERHGEEEGNLAYAQAYGLFNAAWSLGNLVGPLASGVLMERAGWCGLTLSVGVAAGVTVVPAVLLCGGWVFGRQQRRS